MSIPRWLELSNHLYPAFLFHRDCPARRAAQRTSHSDVLRIGRPGEVPAVTSTAFITQCADECVGGGDVDRQRRTGVAARRFHAQLLIACRIFS